MELYLKIQFNVTFVNVILARLLIDGIEPKRRDKILLDLGDALKTSKVSQVEVYDPWTDHWSATEVSTSVVVLPDFKGSIVLKITH